MKTSSRTLAVLLALAVGGRTASTQQARPAASAAPATAAQARRFIDSAETVLASLGVKASRADWVANNFITSDTEELTAEAQEAYGVATQRLALAARRFDRVQLPADVRRKFTLLRLSLAAPPPGNPSDAAELTRIGVGLQADYGKGSYCRPSKAKADGRECLQITELGQMMARSRDPVGTGAGKRTLFQP